MTYCAPRTRQCCADRGCHAAAGAVLAAQSTAQHGSTAPHRTAQHSKRRTILKLCLASVWVWSGGAEAGELTLGLKAIWNSSSSAGPCSCMHATRSLPRPNPDACRKHRRKSDESP
eukprot:3146815-Rhodomonas_salina.3